MSRAPRPAGVPGMDLVEQFPAIVMVGIVVVVGASQFNRVVGSVLGMAFWVGIGILGHFFYARGGVIGFPGLPLSEGFFLLLCLGFFIVQVVSFRNGRARAKMRESYREELRDES